MKWCSPICVLLISLAIASVIEAGCQYDNERAKQATKPLTELSLNLFKKIAAKSASENVVFSPISVALALALVESGAGGSTRTALRNALIGGGNDNGTDPSMAYQALQHLLRIQEDETVLTIANGLFYDREYTLKSEYTSKVKECFESEIDGVDFKNDKRAAVSRINSWISNRTGRRIENLLQPDSITERTKVVLANAIYLKAKWREAFRMQAIETMPFYRQGQDGNAQNVPFLKDLDKYKYADDTDFHTVAIPYSSDDQLDFYIVLPKERNGIRKVEGQLTEAKLRSIVQTRAQRKVDLRFPKFAIRSPIKLKPMLGELGLGPIFEETADFGRMTDQRLHVSDVVHEAFIKVNENGTEAAAATAVVIGVPMSAMVGPTEAPIRFVADHPFIFAIVHQRTETVVFMGKVNHVKEDVN